MTLNRMSGLWARTAIVWFVLTICFGMYLGMTQQLHMSSPHAHMGLLGWVSSALFAFLYAITHAEGPASRGGTVHWVAHNLGAATLVVGLFLTLRGVEGYAFMMPLGGGVVVLATLWLAVSLWPRLRQL